MSLFLVLPPRPVFAKVLEHAVGKTLPGVPGVPLASAGPELTEAVTEALSRQPDLYVLFREDLQDDDDVPGSLREGFGAENGDEVIELRLSAEQALQARSWRYGDVSAA